MHQKIRYFNDYFVIFYGKEFGRMELSDEFEDRLNAYFVGGITIFVPSFLLYMIFSI
jgi:hypothetical protein